MNVAHAEGSSLSTQRRKLHAGRKFPDKLSTTSCFSIYELPGKEAPGPACEYFAANLIFFNSIITIS